MMWILKATVLLAGVFGFAALLRRASPAARHLVWAVGLTGILAVPVLSSRLAWHLPLLPARSDQPAQPTTVALDVPSVPTNQAEARAPAEAPSPSPSVTMRDAPPPPSAALERPAGERAITLPSTATLWRLLPAIWLVGALVVGIRLFTGMAAVWWIARRAEPLDDGTWLSLVARVRRRFGLRVPVDVVVSEQSTMPFTAGLFRPIVVLPPAARSWSAERRLAVLQHELAHVRRRDLVAHLISQAACAVYWFHPLAWIAAARMRSESERACDALVLEAGTRPSDYAEHLLGIVRGVRQSWTPAVALPMARRSEFEGRLLAILESDFHRRGLSRASAAFIVVLVTGLVVPLAALVPEARTRMGDAGPMDLTTAAIEAQVPANPRLGPGHVEPDLATADADRRAQVARDDRSAEIMSGSVADEQSRDASTPSGGAPQATAARSPVTALVAGLADRDPSVRLEIVKALGSYQDTSAIAALSRALAQDEDPSVRRAAAWALGEIEDAQAIPALGRALRQDPDPTVRQMAAHAIGEIEDPAGVEPLGAALANETDPPTRAQIIEALGEIEDPAAIPALTRVLSDSSAELRAAAAYALGEVEDPRAVEPLAQALTDGDVQVRLRAAWALGEIEDGRAVEPLTRVLDDPAREVRLAAVVALGDIEDGRAVDPLVGMLGDQDAEIRRRAATALGDIEDSRAVEPLGRLLRSDADPNVRAAAASALGDIETRGTAPLLAAALQDASVDVRRRAASGLGDVDELRTAPPQLIAALQDADGEVRRRAARSLGDIGDPAAVEGLTALLHDVDTQTRRTAMWALSEIHDPSAYQVLVNALQDEDPEIRRLAARALGNR